MSQPMIEQMSQFGNERFNISAIVRWLDNESAQSYDSSVQKGIALTIRLIKAQEAALRAMQVREQKEQAAAEPDELTLQRDDLAILVRRLCRHRSDRLAEQAMDYLGRKGLRGSILRVGEIPEAARPLSSDNPSAPQCTCGPTELDDPNCPVHSIPNWQKGTIPADPPPPGDALLAAKESRAEFERIVSMEAGFVRLDLSASNGHYLNESINRQWEIWQTALAWADDRLAAAEARAQGMEADQHAMRAALQSIASGFDDSAMPQKIARATLAALAPDSGKERG